MKNYKILCISLVVVGSFLVSARDSKAYTCSLGFSSPHGNVTQVGDRVTWTLRGDFTGGRSYWFGTKDGVADVSGADTTLSNPFTWTTDPYPSNTTGSYTRWIQVNDANGYFLCQTNTVFVSVTAATTTTSVSISPAAISLSIQSGASISTYPSGWVGFTVSPNQLINWTAQSSANWLTVSPSGSAYSTGGTSIVVNSQAVNLVPGTYSGTITFYPAGSPSFTPQTVSVILTVRAATTTPLTITNNSPLPSAIVGTYYSLDIIPDGGTIRTYPGRVSWNIIAGSLPPGLYSGSGSSICSNVGCMGIGGTPTTAGTFNFTISVSDGISTFSKSFALTVTTPTATPTPVVYIYNLTDPTRNPVSWTGDYLRLAVSGLTPNQTKTIELCQTYLGSSRCDVLQASIDYNGTWRTEFQVLGISLGSWTRWVRVDGVASNLISYTVVNAPTPGTLSFSQNSFNFSYVQGGPTPPSQSLTYTNTSNINIVYTLNVSNKPGWLNTSYATTQLTASPGQVTGLGASVNPSGLNPGTYSSSITVTGNFVGSPLSIPVTLTVTSATPTPTITEASINGPGYGATGINHNYTFRASSNTANSLLIFKINWGDGTITQDVGPNGYPKNFSHQWSKEGSYTITFTASLPDNSQVYKTTTLNVSMGSFATPTPTPSPTVSPTPTPTCYWWENCGQTPTPTPTPTPAITLTPTPTTTPIPPPITSCAFPSIGQTTIIDQNRLYSLSEICDGDLIRGQGDIAVWIVKIVGEKRFKRWLFGPQIFNVYGHLGFNKVKNVSKETLNKFDTSNLIRKYGDAKVYELTDFIPGRSATRRWIQTLEIFLQRGFDFDSVYVVNQGEFNLYAEGSPLPITKADETKSNLPLTGNISEAMMRFLGR